MYGDGSCLAAGLVAALDVEGRDRTGSVREWKPGSARCGTLKFDDWGMEWW